MTTRLSRRKALRLGAAAGALPLVNIRTAGAAGQLSLALWDHWVPTGDDAMRKLIDAWAEKNKVDVQLDFLTGVGNKINITMAAEAQAKTGHDVYAFDMWTVHAIRRHARSGRRHHEALIAKYGKIGQAYEYLGVVERALEGGAGRLGIGAADTLRAHQPAEEIRRHRRAEMVPRRASDPGDLRRLDLRHPAQGGRGLLQGRLPVRLRLRLRRPTPTRPGVPRSARSGPIWWMPRARSPSIPTTSGWRWNTPRS